MYYLYKKSVEDGRVTYRRVQEVPLFGSNNGLIPLWLRRQLSPDQTQPMGWKIRVPEALAAFDLPGDAIVIDMAPKRRTEPKLLLFELASVWGYSSRGQTPLLFHLRGLLVDQPSMAFEKETFSAVEDRRRNDVVSFAQLEGTIQEGKLVGAWSAPSSGPTNSALLWPYTYSYFRRILETEVPGFRPA